MGWFFEEAGPSEHPVLREDLIRFKTFVMEVALRNEWEPRQIADFLGLELSHYKRVMEDELPLTFQDFVAVCRYLNLPMSKVLEQNALQSARAPEGVAELLQEIRQNEANAAARHRELSEKLARIAGQQEGRVVEFPTPAKAARTGKPLRRKQN